MSVNLPSLPALGWRRRGLVRLAIATAALGTALPCRAQADAQTGGAVTIAERPNTQIAADFIGKSGVALSVVTPNPASSSVTVAVAPVPVQQPGLAAQIRLLTPTESAFRSLIPVGAVVSILDSRLLFDYADIYGSDNVVLVLLQYN